MNINNIFSNSVNKNTFNIIKQSEHYETIVSGISKTYDHTQIQFLNHLSPLQQEQAAYILYKMYNRSSTSFDEWFYIDSKDMDKISKNYSKYIKLFIDNGLIERKVIETDVAYKNIINYKFLLIPNYSITTISSAKFLKKIISNQFGGNIPIRIRLGLMVINAYWALTPRDISDILDTEDEYKKYIADNKKEKRTIESFKMKIQKQIKMVIEWNNSNAYERLEKVIFKHETDHRFHYTFTYIHKKLRPYVTMDRKFIQSSIDMGQSQAVTMSESIFNIVGDNAWTDMINAGKDLYTGYTKDEFNSLPDDKQREILEKRKKLKADFFVIPYDDYTSESKSKFLYKKIMNIFGDNKPYKAIKNITKIKSSKVKKLYSEIKNKKRLKESSKVKKNKKLLKESIKAIKSTRNFNINGYIIPTDNDSYLRFSQLNQRFESMMFEDIWSTLLDMEINFMPLHDGIYFFGKKNIEYVRDVMTGIASKYIKNTKFKFEVEEV